MSPAAPHERLIAALDVPDARSALALGERLRGSVGLLKIGLELFCAEGPPLVRELGRLAPIFLDLKLCDIPNTMESAARQLGALGATLVTVHASAGAAAVAAAIRGIRAGASHAGLPEPAVLGVTVLTSLDSAALSGLGYQGTVDEIVLRLGRLALAAGARGLVCSPKEVRTLRAEFGPTPLLVVPGIRPAGAPLGDQARTATAGEAIAAGADLLVVGRPLRDARDPKAMADELAAEILQASRPTLPH